MKSIDVNTLRVGQAFTDAVYIEDENMLVPAGVAVRKKDIDRLKAWGIKRVHTNGLPVADKPVTPATPKEAAPAEKTGSSPLLSLPAVQENQAVYRTYTDFIDRLDTVFQQIGEGATESTRAIDTIVSRLLTAVRDNRDQMIGFILGGEVSGKELAKSSINTAILATLMAIELKIAHHRVLHITTGALLHDIGMTKLPKEITEKKGGLSGAEVQRMKSHPLYGFKIICKELLYPEDVGVIALQHHERWDGEGYPRQLAGEAIDIGARIVSVADAFEAMVSEKPYRSSMIGYQAMKSLLSDNSRRFDPTILKAFIKTLGIYPIGSIVLLNSGAIARVVLVHEEAPLRPGVRILIDDFGKTYELDEGEYIDLFTEKSLFIARALDPKQLTGAE